MGQKAMGQIPTRVVQTMMYVYVWVKHSCWPKTTVGQILLWARKLWAKHILMCARNQMGQLNTPFWPEPPWAKHSSGPKRVWAK